MIDWKATAQARGLEIPAEELDAIAPTLDAIEEAFRPLVSLLPHDLEPATILSEAAVDVVEEDGE